MHEYWFHVPFTKRRMRPTFTLLATMAILLAASHTAQAEGLRSPRNSGFANQQENPYLARREKLRASKTMHIDEDSFDAASPPQAAPVAPDILPPSRKTADAGRKPLKVYVPNLANFKGSNTPLTPATVASVTVLDQQLAQDAPEKPPAQKTAATPSAPSTGTVAVPAALAKILPPPTPPVVVAQVPAAPAPTETAPVVLSRETTVIAPIVAPPPVNVAAAAPPLPTPEMPPQGDVALASAVAVPLPPPLPPSIGREVVAQTPEPLIYVRRKSLDVTKEQEAAEAAQKALSQQAEAQVRSQRVDTELLAALAPAAEGPPLTTAPTDLPPPPAAAPSEPPPELSQATQRQLKAVPSKIDTPKGKSKEKIAIDTISPPEEEKIPGKPEHATAESMGMKIDIRKPSFDANTTLERAYNTLNSGDTEGAADLYREVLASDSTNQDALFSLATIYQRAGALDKARPLYQQLLKVNPRHREGLNNFLGLAADEAPEAALHQLEALEERNPDFSAIPAQMAMIYQKLGQADLAIEKMSHAVSLAPENVTYRYNLAIMFDKSGRKQEAEKIYQLLVDAAMSGQKLPGDVRQVQERLIFLRSNRAS